MDTQRLWFMSCDLFMVDRRSSPVNVRDLLNIFFVFFLPKGKKYNFWSWLYQCRIHYIEPSCAFYIIQYKENIPEFIFRAYFKKGWIQNFVFYLGRKQYLCNLISDSFLKWCSLSSCFFWENILSTFFSDTQSEIQWVYWKATKQASDCRSDWFGWMMKNIENFQKRQSLKKKLGKINEKFSSWHS